MIRVTVFAGPSPTDEREPSVVEHIVEESHLHEKLRHIGLEWRNADYMTQRQVVITLMPIPPGEPDKKLLQEHIRIAASQLEATGLL